MMKQLKMYLWCQIYILFPFYNLYPVVNREDWGGWLLKRVCEYRKVGVVERCFCLIRIRRNLKGRDLVCFWGREQICKKKIVIKLLVSLLIIQVCGLMTFQMY